MQRSGRSRWSFDEGDSFQEVLPGRKEQEGCHGGERVKELAPGTVFLARQALEFVRDFAHGVHGEGKQV